MISLFQAKSGRKLALKIRATKVELSRGLFHTTLTGLFHNREKLSHNQRAISLGMKIEKKFS